MERKDFTPEIKSEFEGLFGNQVSFSEPVLVAHGNGESYHPVAKPDAVVFAQSTEDVSKAVKLCYKHSIPVVPYGVGTSLEGHVNALFGGVTVDVSGMDQILEINEEDLDCRVQAGVTRIRLNEDLRATGLFFPIDPGADASIGGMAATRASGTNAVRYGTMREVVLGLTVVKPDGDVIKTGGRARKSASGYDLTRLYIGSEGTLGVITEIQLRLYGQPEAITAATCPFPDIGSAVSTAMLVIQSGIPVARMELVCEKSIAAVNKYSKLSLDEKPTLFFEFHGTEAWAKEQAELVGDITSEFGGEGFQWATEAEDRNKLWAARHSMYHATRAAYPGCNGLTTDVCVPISRLAEAMEHSAMLIEKHNVIAPIVGHVGDGNFHLAIMVNPDDEDHVKRAKAVSESLVENALELGGTCTGEHGIGYGKIGYLESEHGDAVNTMAAIKAALDSKGIMNPGKIISV